jgi:prepilin-type N-terminal cleavage/methylation domain-containing protein
MVKRIKTNEHGFGLIEVVVVILAIGLVFAGGYYIDRVKTPKNSSPSLSTSRHAPNYSSPNNNSNDNTNNDPSPSTQSGGEQLSTKGMTRPSQYLQICATASNIEYVTQGSPQCLGTDTYEGSYSPGVPGTLFSSPCQTTGGTVRYVYISENESCPDSTKLVFYNTLCPSDASSSDDCTTPSSSDTTTSN